MVGIVKTFGWLSIILALILSLVSIAIVFLLPILLPIAANALLGGALLIVFARIVELLESLDAKVSPVFALASSLEAKTKLATAGAGVPQATPANDEPAYLLRNPPANARITKHKDRRVVILDDGAVVAETLVGGARSFSSIEEFKDFVGG